MDWGLRSPFLKEHMSKITLNSIGILTDSTTAQNALNVNNATIQSAFDNTLSRDGSAPNQMNALIDMNGFPILNIGSSSLTVATLPAGVIGRINNVTDGAASLAWGATVTGGGSTKYLVWYNGSAWTVIGK